MADYNSQEKVTLNSIISLCLENRFNEAHQAMLKQAGLSLLNGSITTPELRRVIDERTKNGVAPAISGEILRIENTFLYLRDIEQYNMEQAKSIICNLDQTIPYLNNHNKWKVLKKIENVFHHSGQAPIYHELYTHHKAIDKVNLLNRKIKNKKEPALTPIYFAELKKKISGEGIVEINKELETPKSNNDKIRLNEEKIYLIDNSDWSRNQRFLAKSETYGQLQGLYLNAQEPQKALEALEKQSRFFEAHKATIQHNPKAKQNQMHDEWIYK